MGNGISFGGGGGGDSLGGVGGGLSKFVRGAPSPVQGGGRGIGIDPSIRANVPQRNGGASGLQGLDSVMDSVLRGNVQSGVLPTNPGDYAAFDDGTMTNFTKYSYTPAPPPSTGAEGGRSLASRGGISASNYALPEGAWLVDNGSAYILPSSGGVPASTQTQIGETFTAPATYNPNYQAPAPIQNNTAGSDLAFWEAGYQPGLAHGGIVPAGEAAYAEGGEVAQGAGGEMSPYEQELTQGAIAALTGAIQDQEAANEILAEFENVFGEGAVEELAQEIENQGGSDGMDDSVTARLTPGELVVSNDQLSDYGNGDREIGAQKLQQHLKDVEQARRGQAGPPKRINPAALG